jgi:hypothetical protein
MAAPGWYDDPNAPGGMRWWDGTQWTDHVAAPPAPAAPGLGPTPPYAPARPAQPAEPYPSGRIALAAIAGFAVLLLIVGSVGTWVDVQATSGAFHVGQTKGGLDRDGAITLGIAIVCLILVGVWAARLGPPVARIAIAGVIAFFGFLGVIIAIADIADVQSKGNSIVDASAGWGLWLCLVASLALLATMIVGLAVRKLR